MEQQLNWDEIKSRYADEWVMLVDYEWKERELNPYKARVVVHSDNEKDFWAQAKKTDYKESAILFTGEFPAKGLQLWKSRPSR
jgi:hypothetical protein